MKHWLIVILLVIGGAVEAALVKSEKELKTAKGGKSANKVVAHKAPVKAFPHVTLQWSSETKNHHWLFEKGAIYRGPAHLAPLALVKKMEFEENYEGCTAQIQKIWAQYTPFRGWLALQGTQCLVNQLKFADIKESGLYVRWWNHLMHQGEWTVFGAWSAELLKARNELAQLMLKNNRLPIGFRSEVAESWRQYVDNLSRSERQDLFRVIIGGMQAEGQGDWAQAIAVREGLAKAVSETSAATNLTQGLSRKTTEKPDKNITEESELYQKFLDLLKVNQLAGATDLAVRMLDRYPNGLHSAATQDKLMQSYFAMWEYPASNEQKAQLEKCLDLARGLHSSRLFEWAKAAHRRADFRGAYQLAKQALSNDEKSPDGAAILYIAGRAAYFMGEYREAIGFFDRIIQRHSGYSEIWEVKLRRALGYIRLDEGTKAEEALTELWLDPSNKAYALPSLYWLIRLRQKRKASVDELLLAMQERFSLTYYGLKLSAELNQQKISLPSETSPVVINQNWVLTPSEKAQWGRVQDLATAGWYTAAQGELNNLTYNGGDEQKFIWAHELAQIFAYPQALKILNDLSDIDPRWKRTNYLRTVFPKPLEYVVEVEAKNNQLSPILVYSLIRQESAFYLGATSRSQAKGLMQLIPPTANEIAQELKIKNFDSDQMYQPTKNLKFGIYYLAKVIRQFGGNVSIGLAAYNAGPHRLKKFFEARTEVENTALLSQEDPWSELWVEELPWLETNLYVKSILRNRIIYQVLDQGSFDWPTPIWKDLFLGVKKVSQVGKGSRQRRTQ